MAEKIKQAKDLVTECQNLQKFWSDRDTKMKDWYKILKQNDEFKTEGMESFVTNEPRTFYNLSKHLLGTGIPHRIPIDLLGPMDLTDAANLEDAIVTGWRNVDARYRRSGRKSFLKRVIGTMLATGWYSVFTYIDDTGFYADAWSPAEVYPEWDDERLVKCARIYKLKPDAANRKAKQKGWQLKQPFRAETVFYNYWFLDENGNPINCVIAGNEYVKTPEYDNDFEEIPIFISPVSGLEDLGILDEKWMQSIGESVLATNEIMYKQYNKQWTFSAQLMRDTAQPRWFERSSEGHILKKEDMFKRGAIFRGGINDSVEALAVPPLPIELRTDRFDIQNMLQRGSLPYALFGNLQQNIAGYLMSQIASAAQEILNDYKDSISQLFSDIDNYWAKTLTNTKYNPYDSVIPPMKPNFVFDCSYQLRIPGDIVQRATVARMVCPDFEVDVNTTMDMLFPEITNPLKVRAEARKDRALNSEISIQVDAIAAYRQQAENMRRAGNKYHAELYDKLASAMEAQIFGQPTQPQTGGPQQIAGPSNQAGAQPRPEQTIPEELR